MLAAMLGLPAFTPAESQAGTSGAGASQAGWGYPEATAADVNEAAIKQALELAPKHVADRCGWLAQICMAPKCTLGNELFCLPACLLSEALR